MAKVIGMVNILLCKADKFKWLKIWSWLAARLEYKRGGGGGGGGRVWSLCNSLPCPHPKNCVFLLYIQSLFLFVIGKNASDNSRYLEAVALFQLLTPSASCNDTFLDRNSVQKKVLLPLLHAVVTKPRQQNGFAFFLAFEYIIKRLLITPVHHVRHLQT
jgi:hypothetical protein